MNKVGRRLYYELDTGNIILDTGERMGNVVQTTVDQDVSNYKILNERVRDTFDVVELPYGTVFKDIRSLRVDPATKQIQDGYDPLFTLNEFKQFKNDEMFQFYKKDLLNGFTSSLTNTAGVAYEFFYDEDGQSKINSQTNKVNLILNRLSLGQITQEEFDAYFPIYWRTKNLGVVQLSYEDYIVFADEVENHERSLLTKRLQKEAEIDSYTRTEEIERVTW